MSAGCSDDAVFARPRPTVGDTSSARERAESPGAWSLGASVQQALALVQSTRRDVRRFRPDSVPDHLVGELLRAAHSAPSVGHSQPWRFVLVTRPETRERAAWLADRERHAQAALLDAESGRHLLDLQLDGVREAPLGIVVCCDRRAAPQGVLGRATFPDADMWSCACAIQNLWLAARAHGLGVGWVTLFQPAELAALVGLPEGVDVLGWLCIGYPDERNPSPGLELRGWSSRAPIDALVFRERWPDAAPPAPRSRLRAPEPERVVAARDATDALLSPPGALGRLDQALDRVVARIGGSAPGGVLVLVGGDHPVADLGVTAYQRSVTADVLAAARLGTSVGAAAAAAVGIETVVIDGGSSAGDLVHSDAMSNEQTARLVEVGRAAGLSHAPRGLVAIGEVGMGNTTVAAALACAVLGVDPVEIVGLGSGADSAMVARKREVVTAALARCRIAEGGGAGSGAGAGSGSGSVAEVSLDAAEVMRLLRMLGGPEFAVLVGVALGVAEGGGVVVLDGMATTVAALIAAIIEPAVAAHLVAGQRSREKGHDLLLRHLGLSPLLDLRLRCGEGVGAVMATGLLLDGLAVRRTTARVRES